MVNQLESAEDGWALLFCKEAYSSVWDLLSTAFSERAEKGSLFSKLPKARRDVSFSPSAHTAMERTCPEHWAPGHNSHPSAQNSDLPGRCPYYQGIQYLSEIAHLWETELNSQESVQTAKVFRWKLLQNCKLLYLTIELLRLCPLKPRGVC